MRTWFAKTDIEQKRALPQWKRPQYEKLVKCIISRKPW